MIYSTFLKISKSTILDLESVLIPSTDNIDFDSDAGKYQGDIISSYDYKSICLDERYNKPYKTYFGQDTIDKL